MERVKQCPTCPWRVDCIPAEDIPNGYSVERHVALQDTIATPGSLCPTRIMACHYSKVGEEFPCAGWLHHQLGPGNNLWLRVQVLKGEMPTPEIDGDQCATFEETLR